MPNQNIFEKKCYISSLNSIELPLTRIVLKRTIEFGEEIRISELSRGMLSWALLSLSFLDATHYICFDYAIVMNVNKMEIQMFIILLR